MASPTDIEKESLEAHVELCAMRYGQLETRLENIEKKVGTLSELIEKSNNSMFKVMIGTAGTVVAGIISLVVAILMKA
jgi:tetrahydromethanopterin S-methyltransferase subunit G